MMLRVRKSSFDIPGSLLLAKSLNSRSQNFANRWLSLLSMMKFRCDDNFLSVPKDC